MRHYMVVANQSLGGEELMNVIKDRMGAGPCDFFVVVPATPAKELVPNIIPMPVMGGVPLLEASPEEGRKAAEARLQSALKQLAAAGATTDGHVGDPDPVHAVENALASRQFDEIIVSTLPAHVSRWLHQDLPHRLQHKFHLPVTHVEVTNPRPIA